MQVERSLGTIVFHYVVLNYLYSGFLVKFFTKLQFIEEVWFLLTQKSHKRVETKNFMNQKDASRFWQFLLLCLPALYGLKGFSVLFLQIISG
jgi:hypothetical protein